MKKYHNVQIERAYHTGDTGENWPYYYLQLCVINYYFLNTGLTDGVGKKGDTGENCSKPSIFVNNYLFDLLFFIYLYIFKKILHLDLKIFESIKSLVVIPGTLHAKSLFSPVRF